MAENNNWSALPQLVADLDIIQKLDDEPNDVGGLTAAELKAKFDEAANTIKTYLNGTLLPAVQEAGEATEGDAGEAAEELETALNAHTGDNVRHITAAERATWNGKQDVLRFDNTPTSGSSNPVTSGGVYTALSGKEETLIFDSTPTSRSSNPVYSDGIYRALETKQNTLTFDSTPTAGSTNPVTSGGVKTALDGKQDKVPIAAGAGTNALVENNAEGNIAIGNYSHAEGVTTHAIGRASHAEGSGTTANGAYSHAEGDTTAANGMNSHAEGEYTRATHLDQHVFGAYNERDPSGNNANFRGTFVEIVGNGTSDNDRSNARTLDWNGNEVLAGKLTLGAGPVNNMDAATKEYVDSQSGGGGVSSFNGRSGAVTPQSGDYTAAQVGADQAGAAADVQLNLDTHDGNTIKHITAAERTAWNGKAPLASPSFTGAPVAPTPTLGDDSTKIATTAFVNAAVSAAIGTAIGGAY